MKLMKMLINGNGSFSLHQWVQAFFKYSRNLITLKAAWTSETADRDRNSASNIFTLIYKAN